MRELGSVLINLFAQAWDVLAFATLVVTILFILYAALRGSSAVAVGASVPASQVIVSAFSLFLLAIFGFLLVPSLVRGTIQAYAATVPRCSVDQSGFFVEATTVALQLLVGVSALRMIKAVFVSVVMSGAGAPGGVASAVLEIAEVVAASLVLTIIVPIIAATLGC